MKRVTFKILKEWINDWNTGHPETQFVVRSYNDYYHIESWENGTNIITAKSPGLAWDQFWVWMDGYRRGVEIGKTGGGVE